MYHVHFGVTQCSFHCMVHSCSLKNTMVTDVQTYGVVHLFMTFTLQIMVALVEISYVTIGEVLIYIYIRSSMYKM